jgi:hypothetical protein
MYSRAQLLEEIWDQEMARYDAVRERYHREAEDMRREDQYYYEHMEYLQKVKDSGLTEQEYDDRWKRTYTYIKTGAVEEFYEPQRD